MSEAPHLVVFPPATASPAPAVTDIEPRCWHCKMKLGYLLTRPWRMRCGRCRAKNESPPS